MHIEEILLKALNSIGEFIGKHGLATFLVIWLIFSWGKKFDKFLETITYIVGKQEHIHDDIAEIKNDVKELNSRVSPSNYILTANSKIPPTQPS